MNAIDLVNHLPALPEVLLLAGACVVMIADARRGRQASVFLAQLVLLACALATLWVLSVQWDAGGSRLFIFNGLFVSDLMSGLLKLVAYAATSMALVYSRQYLVDRDLLRGEFLSLLLFSLLGMMIMISANSFLTVYLGLELMSLCLYALVALNRDSGASTEAAMKYFILGALSSGLLLYGMSMIYGATGSLDLREISAQVRSLLGAGPDRIPMRPFLVFGLVFVVAGVAFKVGVAPFHMWIPDVYHGAPTPVTLIIGSGPKLAALAMAIRLLVNGLLDLAILSMAIGNITAIAQSNLKRMLAYSTIAHMGFMLLGLMSGVVRGNTLSAPEAYSSALFYGVVYVLMSLAAFGMILFLARPGFEADTLDDLRGLSKRSPWYAFVMMVVMLSLAGLPPTVGFYAKLAVFQSAVAAGHIWLTVVAVLLSLVGAFYYLRIIKLMYFDEMRDSPLGPRLDRGSPGVRWLLSANGMALLVLGILPQGLMALCLVAIQSLKLVPG
jgi:NADH-quinone oxidoreductase subunit N